MNSTDIAETIRSGLAARHARERRFRAYGLAAIGFAGLMLVILMLTILRPGLSGLTRHELRMEIDTAPFAAMLEQEQKESLRSAKAARAGAEGERGGSGSDGGLAPRVNEGNKLDFYLHTNAMLRSMADPAPGGAGERRQLAALLGFFAADDVKRQVIKRPEQWKDAVTVWVPLSSNADMLLKDDSRRGGEAATRTLNDQQIAWLDDWQKDGRIRRSINWEFFGRGDSRAPESAGFLGAIVGSLLALVVCMGLAMPIAIMAAITLEEFARKTRIAEALEVLINNLAAVPSIIYGLLGLSVFLQVMHLPRSSALVGGLTLSIMILPVMIIAARAAIRAVPPSMRQAATALGATRLQVVRHHVLPYALPGIMTGTILAVCRALGETAPLLMIGMVAFVADIPRGPTDPATAMPVEIYLWASTPEAGFIEKTSSGILVLLVILLLLNMAAIRLRNRSQLTWN